MAHETVEPRGARAAMAATLVADEGVATMVLDVLDAVPFYVLLVDEKHNILLANSAVREAFGQDPAKLLGAYCPRVIHGTDEPYAGCPLEQALATERPAVVELLDEKSGRWLESAVYPTRHRTRAGARVYLHLVRDISDRKRAEQDRAELAVSLEEALAKAISGFVPICAGCRKIRAEDETWHPAEEYITRRTGAELSHGLCPECVIRLYGK